MRTFLFLSLLSARCPAAQSPMVNRGVWLQINCRGIWYSVFSIWYSAFVKRGRRPKRRHRSKNGGSRTTIRVACFSQYQTCTLMTTQGYAVASVWTFISWMGGLETMFQVKCIETPKLFQTAKRQMDVTDIAPYKDSATDICSICAPALSMRSLFSKWFPVGSSVNVGAHRFGKNLQLPNGAIATITGQHPRHEWFPLYCGEASPVFSSILVGFYVRSMHNCDLRCTPSRTRWGAF